MTPLLLAVVLLSQRADTIRYAIILSGNRAGSEVAIREPDGTREARAPRQVHEQDRRLPTDRRGEALRERARVTAVIAHRDEGVLDTGDRPDGRFR